MCLPDLLGLLLKERLLFLFVCLSDRRHRRMRHLRLGALAAAAFCSCNATAEDVERGIQPSQYIPLGQGELAVNPPLTDLGSDLPPPPPPLPESGVSDLSQQTEPLLPPPPPPLSPQQPGKDEASSETGVAGEFPPPPPSAGEDLGSADPQRLQDEETIKEEVAAKARLASLSGTTPQPVSGEERIEEGGEESAVQGEAPLPGETPLKEAPESPDSAKPPSRLGRFFSRIRSAAVGIAAAARNLFSRAREAVHSLFVRLRERMRRGGEPPAKSEESAAAPPPSEEGSAAPAARDSSLPSPPPPVPGEQQTASSQSA